jgi:TolA-binding protein
MVRSIVFALLTVLAAPALAAPVGAKPASKADAGPPAADGGGDVREAAIAAPPPQACAGNATAASDQQKKAAVPGEKANTGLEVYGKTPEEAAQLRELTLEIQNYEEQSKDFRKEVQLLVEKKYRDKRDLLGGSYEKAITDLEVIQRQERLDAIAQFEEFLSRYPNEARYTPDVMFRLAELYYEKTQDEASEAARQYEEALKLVEQGKLAVPPQEPVANYSKSVDLYRKLLAQFPDYRYNDGTYYLLGYSLEKQGDMDAARASYDALIVKFPGSKFVPEAWVRIGEQYFEETSDASQHKAIEAYAHAITFKEYTNFDKALYKLGWAYYKVDDFDNAVTTFLSLLDYYQSKAGNNAEEVGGDLRNEALQYAAISFADEKWGSVEKAKAWFAKTGPRPYQGEIFKRMGDVFFDQSKGPDSIASYRQFLALAPLDKTAPQVQNRIIETYERDRDFDKASVEREALVENYGPTTKWAEANKRDPDVLKEALTLSEKTLYSAAIFHHKQAIAYQNDGKKELAFREFQTAAKGYGSYLDRFPHSKEAYELTFYYGDCLYNSGEFGKAAKAYQMVRDSNADSKFKLDAAEAAVFSFRNEMEVEQKSGKLESRPVVLSTQRKDGERIDPVNLPVPVKDYVGAIDTYLELFPKCERAPSFAYNAGVIFFTYNQYDEARKRFERVISDYPAQLVAKNATNLIVETYLSAKDWKNVEEKSASLAKVACEKDGHGEACITLTKFKLAGRFKLADELMAKAQYDAAAKKYVELVDEVQAQEKAGNTETIRDSVKFSDLALNNAAFCLEKAVRFESALTIYERLYTQYPNSPLADNALFRVGVNAEQSYDFDRAIERYKKLVNEYPQSKNRPAALANEARLLEGDQRYKDSAAAFQDYATRFPEQDDAPAFQYHAAVIYERMKDYKGEIAALQGFQAKFSKDPKQSELVVEAYKRIADCYTILGDEKKAKTAFEDTVAEYKKRGLKSESNVASNAAAEATFQLAEYEFQTFDKLKIGGRGKALEKSLKDKVAALKKAADAYNQIAPYKRIEWTLASFYRKGFMLERLASSFSEAPIPADVKKMGDEAVATYQDLLGQQAAQYEDKAVEAYTVTLSEAKKARVLNNPWIRLTLESLNRFRPKEYPLLKEPKAALEFDASHPVELADTPVGRTNDLAVAPKPEAASPAPGPASTSAPGPAAPAPAPATKPAGKIGASDDK